DTQRVPKASLHRRCEEPVYPRGVAGSGPCLEGTLWCGGLDGSWIGGLWDVARQVGHVAFEPDTGFDHVAFLIASKLDGQIDEAAAERVIIAGHEAQRRR